MADMKFLDDLTECPIYFNQYQRPRCLPCLHTFCEKCLNEYIASQKKDLMTKDGTFNCPVCRHFINTPSSGSDETKWAEKFPLNYLILTLIDQKSLQEGKLYCNPCKKKSKNEQSVSWCIQCKICLCKVCEEFHTSVPILENHKLVPLGEKEDEAILLSSAHILCGIHSDKPIEMFCLDHDVPCCSTCTMITHRKCENVDTLETVAEKSKLSNIRDQLDKGFSAQLKLVEEKLCNDAKNIDALEENCQKMKDRVEKERDTAILHLKALSDKAISDVCQFQVKQKDAMAGSLEINKGRKATIENCQKLLKASLEQSSDVQFFLESRKLKQKFDEMGKETLELQTIQSSDVSYSYEVRKEISDITAYDSFGELKRGDAKTSDGNPSLSSEGMSQSSEVVVKSREDEPLIFTLGEPKEIDVEANRLNSSVTGCNFLEDGRLVFADFKERVSKDGIIKIYEKDFETFRIVPLKGKPWSLANLNSSYIIVTIPHSSKLVVLDTSTFSIKHTTACDSMCFGLAVQNPLTDSSSLSDDDREKCTIFVSSKGDVCLLNLNGKRLKHISISRTYIRYIAYSSGRLFCSVGDKVVCTDEDGQVKFEFTDDSLHKATGIAVIKDGHFMVCDYGQDGGVSTVDSKGFKRSVLLKQENTSYVAFNKEKDKMCVIKGGPSISNTAYIYNVNKL